MDNIELSNGCKMPAIGYGTWQTGDGEAARCVRSAVEAGYRHIDTAYGYMNERGVGEGIRTCGIAREELFVATKHWITGRGYEKTLAQADESLRNLGLDYIDLYLVHWPAVAKTFDDWRRINADTWSAFEKLYHDGKVRAIGVSNYLPSHIEALREDCEIPPMVDQIEFHPGYWHRETVEWCKKNSIAVEGWSPLGCGKVLSSPLIGEIAAKYGRTPAQICIRYAIGHGVVPLPKSTRPDRIADNLRVFDFSLAAEDAAALDSMPQLGYSGFFPEDAPADELVRQMEK